MSRIIAALTDRLRDQRGVIGVLGVAVYSSAILVISATMITTSVINYRVSQGRLASTQSLYHAESGAEDALLQIKRNSGYGSTPTTLTTQFSNDNYVDTVVDTVSGQGCVAAKQITASGYVGSLVRRVQLSNCPQPSPDADFVYAIQAGAGGIRMDNNSTVFGTTYSNGNHTAGNGARVTGDAWVAGGIAADANPLFDPGTVTDYQVGRNPSNDVAQSFTATDSEKIIKVSLKVKKVGSPSNATVRLAADDGNKPSGTTLASGTLAAASVGSAYSFIDVSFTTNPNLASGSKYWVVIDAGNNNANYWHWASANSYPDQTAKHSGNFGGSWTDANTDMAFKVWTGGVPTFIEGLAVGGNAHANTLNNNVITGDAYFQVNNGSTIGGTSHPGSPDPPTRDLPVTEATVNDFKALADAGTVHAGDYVVPLGETRTIGPIKITGNLIVNNSATLVMAGTVWVEGAVTFTNGSTLRLDPGYGSDSGAMISDNKVLLDNNMVVQGADPGSFVLLVSTTSLEPAIEVKNNAAGVILAAINGTLKVENNAGANALTAYRLHLSNNATVTYVSGLADTKFSAGPGGSFQAKGWREILQ